MAILIVVTTGVVTGRLRGPGTGLTEPREMQWLTAVWVRITAEPRKQAGLMESYL